MSEQTPNPAADLVLNLQAAGMSKEDATDIQFGDEVLKGLWLLSAYTMKLSRERNTIAEYLVDNAEPSLEGYRELGQKLAHAEQELAAARGDADEWKDDAEEWKELHRRASKEGMKLSRELAAAREDGARLDWLEGEKEREAGPFDSDCERSLFRRNQPITRITIDATRKEQADGE